MRLNVQFGQASPNQVRSEPSKVRVEGESTSISQHCQGVLGFANLGLRPLAMLTGNEAKETG
jgi:hypothetical protein